MEAQLTTGSSADHRPITTKDSPLGWNADHSLETTGLRNKQDNILTYTVKHAFLGRQSRLCKKWGHVYRIVPEAQW
ncbi:hypothetical protein Nmel_007056 [Mimus melanotis]